MRILCASASALCSLVMDFLRYDEAHEWIEDAKIRLKGALRPAHSMFRVLCLIVYDVAVEQCQRNLRVHVGLNAETCFIGGSLCAERVALAGLRSIWPPKEASSDLSMKDSVVGLVLVSDLQQEVPLSPGTLCREFLVEHLRLQTPVFMASSHLVQSMTLQELYPHPPMFAGLSVDLSKKLSASMNANSEIDLIINNASSGETRTQWWCLLKQGIEAAYRDDKHELHGISYGAAIQFGDQRGSIIRSSWQSKALEFGATVDPIIKLSDHMLKHISILPSKSSTLRIVQCDSMGTVHSPFAAARAFLVENGMEDTQILVQHAAQSYQIVKASDLLPRAPTFIRPIESE